MSTASKRARAKLASKRQVARQGAAALALTAEDLRALDAAITSIEGVRCSECGAEIPELGDVGALLRRIRGKIGQGATLWFK